MHTSSFDEFDNFYRPVAQLIITTVIITTDPSHFGEWEQNQNMNTDIKSIAEENVPQKKSVSILFHIVTACGFKITPNENLIVWTNEKLQDEKQLPVWE